MQWLTPGRGSRLAGDQVSQIVNVLAAGGSALLPTETGYMWGVRGLCETSIDWLYRAKRRRPDHPVHLAVCNVNQGLSIASLDDRAQWLLSQFTPGPLTIVAPADDRVPSLLQAGTGSIGVRVPDHPATLQVIQALGEPLTATSANLSGQPPQHTPEGIERTLGGVLDERTVGVSGGYPRFEKPSTLIRMCVDGFEVLRHGAVASHAIRESLAEWSVESA